jgi:predicted XRE-type DNA-binding protein
MANGKNSEAVAASSGNVFAGLGLRDAEEKQTRVHLAVAVNQIIEACHRPQKAAARLLDINQPKISALVNYRLEGFSVERLMQFLNALDRDVEIVIRKEASLEEGGQNCGNGCSVVPCDLRLFGDSPEQFCRRFTRYGGSGTKPVWSKKSSQTEY